MNKTVIEVGALVFGILLLIGLYLAYSGQGNEFIGKIEGRISSLWSNNENNTMSDQGNAKTGGSDKTIMPIDLEDAKVLFASL